ncbi:uncharacterized protein I303_106847 [Kwoniella dejecticola CBS 10117]|uniref:Phosphatidylglycerol/phosphatidylinositol transfer protein n=1 Tax=Kwoniella dejecticola CBS 10117 TaxID=1296121 RepID=A0A1A5ZTI7_9TREE|nr:uncharacterized protein I303_08512 [Kwoniella dejecticola CBS 10117]OBR81129.1 hypothetical protein I303_08512 [Kwoniella dejecticola CBS 10117]
MHSPSLFAVLPLLALLPSTLAAPGHFQHSPAKGPLPAFLRRQNQIAIPNPDLMPGLDQEPDSGALDLPPSLNTPTITDPSSAVATAVASGEISIVQGDPSPTPTPNPMPSLWQINTIPQNLLAQPNEIAQAGITTIPTASPISTGVTQLSDGPAVDANANDNQADATAATAAADAPPTATATGSETEIVAPLEYQGDSLLAPTSISMAMAGMGVESSAGLGMDITAAADMTSISTSATGSASMVMPDSVTSVDQSTITSAPSLSPTSSASVSASMSVEAAMNTALSTRTSISSATSSLRASASTSSDPSSNALIANIPTATSTSPVPSAQPETTQGVGVESHTSAKSKGKKIRYKHCADTKGTVTEIKVEPCDGGKGTILDPCHFQAGKNYTITLNYVSPEDSVSPRANLEARDKTSSDGQSRFAYPGQSFDACQYTQCPIKGQSTGVYTYEFVTQNNRFDQLTFNMTNGLDGDSLMCAYFPITFMPNMAGRSLRRNLPFGGMGSRW